MVELANKSLLWLLLEGRLASQRQRMYSIHSAIKKNEFRCGVVREFANDVRRGGDSVLSIRSLRKFQSTKPLICSLKIASPKEPSVKLKSSFGKDPRTFSPNRLFADSPREPSYLRLAAGGLFRGIICTV